jgi:hypothetical protein
MQHERATQEPDGAGASELEGLARARSATGDPATNISEAIRLQAARGDQEAVIL